MSDVALHKYKVLRKSNGKIYINRPQNLGGNKGKAWVNTSERYTVRLIDLFHSLHYFTLQQSVQFALGDNHAANGNVQIHVEAMHHVQSVVGFVWPNRSIMLYVFLACRLLLSFGSRQAYMEHKPMCKQKCEKRVTKCYYNVSA